MTPTRKTVAINSQDTKQKTYWREREEKESSMIALCAREKQKRETKPMALGQWMFETHEG